MSVNMIISKADFSANGFAPDVVNKMNQDDIRVNRGKKCYVGSLYSQNGIPKFENAKTSSYLIDVSPYIGKTIIISINNYTPSNWWEGAILNDKADMSDFENLPINNTLPEDNFVSKIFWGGTAQEKFIVTQEMKWAAFTGDINIYPDVYIVG